MYANAPHASVANSPVSPLHQHPQQQVQQHVQTQGMPTAATHGGPHGITPQGFATQGGAVPSTAFVTGAYQSSGDPAIDRMLRLEAALKRFGSPI